MSDIVRDPYGNPLNRDKLITALRAENERLRAALKPFACMCSVKGEGIGGLCFKGSCLYWNARFALSFAEQEDNEDTFQPYTCSRCLGATENADDLCDDCAKEASDDA